MIRSTTPYNPSQISELDKSAIPIISHEDY
jgi:hypothetical protein